MKLKELAQVVMVGGALAMSGAVFADEIGTTDDLGTKEVGTLKASGEEPSTGSGALRIDGSLQQGSPGTMHIGAENDGGTIGASGHIKGSTIDGAISGDSTGPDSADGHLSVGGNTVAD